MLEELPKIFFEVHSNLPREGPGDNKSTKKAYQMLKELPENPRALDVGCGPGMQTIELAKLSGSKIVALDFHQPFLEQLKASAEKENLQHKIETVLGNMFDLKFNYTRYSHDSQTFFKKITDNIIAKYVDFKPNS